MSIDKAALLKGTTDAPTTVDLEEHGGSVFVRRMNAAERFILDNFDATYSDEATPKQLAGLAKLIEFGLADSAGNRLLNDGEGLMFVESNTVETCLHLAHAIQSHNLMLADSVESAEGN